MKAPRSAPRLRSLTLACLLAVGAASSSAQAQSLLDLYEAARGFDATWLAAQDASTLATMALRPHPAARWHHSPAHPAFALWQAHRNGLALPADIAWQGDGGLLTRPQGAVQWTALPAAGTAFLNACARGDRLETAALAALAGQIGEEVKGYGSLAKVPAEAVGNVRNDMYLSSETIRLMDKGKVGNFDADTQGKLQLFKQQIDNATRFIPLWVKIVVAIALGLGTMVGWKRIVVTVGEKIGKTHLTYAQGASAETVAMLTIGAADMFGLPVSTTHVLSSGVAGTMVANGGGLQMRTIRNLLMAWVLTLPAAIVLSGSLYWLFTKLF